VDFVAVQGGVGAGEVDEFEDAEPGVEALVGEGALGPDLLAVDDHHLAGLEFADEGGPDDVEGGRLRRQDPTLIELVGCVQATQAERTEAVGVAHPDDPVGIDEHEGEGALDTGQDLHQRPLEVAAVVGPRALGQVGRKGLGQQFGHQVAVGGDQAGQHVGLLGQGVGIGQIAVVGETESGTSHPPEYRLGVDPVTRPRRGIAGVADSQVASEAGEFALVEYGGDEAHVLHDRDEVAIADGHACGLLATMLEGEEAVEGEVCDRSPRGVDPEDSARFLGLHHRLVTTHTGGRRACRSLSRTLPLRPHVHSSATRRSPPPVRIDSSKTRA